jgi:2,4-dienoyl-CoA reductase (NADPH2)
MHHGEKKYPHVFSPGRIGKLETKNRIKYASTETNFNDKEGFVTDTEVAYMEAQARGGAGIVTTQGAFTDPKGEGKGYVGMMGIWKDEYVPGLKRIADVIHKHGALACLQLMHCGRVGGVELDYCVGPSAVPQALPIFRPQREMTKEQVQAAVQEHIDGARRAVEAGYDMIEISGIVGYLVSNFVSKYTNRRTDEYGGDIRGRCRFMTEIIRGIRRQVGPQVPIIIRLCGEERLDDRGGNTPEESLESIKLAEEAGIDCLSVTAGWQESGESVITRDIPMGHWLFIAERMKRNIKVPVSMAYRLFVPELPEKAIAEGRLDFWEMCRPMIADPFLPRKIAEDRQEDIIPCMACNICLSRLFRDQPLNCMVRPSLGHESEPEWGFYGFAKAPQRKKVAVVGGGLAGLQCAAIAAERGHDVTLYERSGRFGGQLATAAKGPYGDNEFQRMIDYLVARGKKQGVEYRLETAATPEKVGKVDVAVVATGATPMPPKVPGGDSKKIVTAHDLLEGKVDAGQRVCILGGLGVGISVAQYLVVKGGHEVTLLSEEKKIGRDVNPSYIWRYKLKLKKGKVKLFEAAKVKEITPEGVKVALPDGTEQTVAADTIVTSLLAPVNDLVEPLKQVAKEVVVIGDALQPRRGNNAIADGYKAGMKI